MTAPRDDPGSGPDPTDPPAGESTVRESTPGESTLRAGAAGSAPDEPRRPLLMDPAGHRPAGFAPPTRVAPPTGVGAPAAARGRTGPGTPVPTGDAAGHGTTLSPTGPATSTARAATARVATARAATAGAPTASPWAPGRSPALARPGRPHTPSVLAGPTPVVDAPPAAAPGPSVENSFGPVSRMVTISIRTPSSRVDLALADRTTIAEVLETVLDVAPRSLREQAIARGGWILHTAAGRPLPGSTTLLDEGIGTGSTLLLAGADTTPTTVIYDDVADAVADATRPAGSARTAGAVRAIGLGATGAFGALGLLGVLALGPPWTMPALLLAGLAVALQGLAAIVARRPADQSLAVTFALLSVPGGALAAALAATGRGPLTGSDASSWLLGALTAAVLAGTATFAVGARPVVLGATLVGSVLLAVALAVDAAFDVGRSGTAALVCGLAICLMPVLPGLSLRIAAVEPDPGPAATGEAAAVRGSVDARQVWARTARAVRVLTSFVHGLAWPALAAGAVLAVGDEPAGPALAGVVGLAMVLRGRLFPTPAQRLPLVLAGLGCLLAVPAGMLLRAGSTSAVAAAAALAGGGALVAAAVAVRRRPVTPGLTRTAEILDLVLTVAVIPLVAAVLGAFAFVRGLGG